MFCSAVGIATHYELEGRGIETRWKRNFLHLSGPSLVANQPPLKWVTHLTRRQSGRGVALTAHPHLAPKLRKE